MLTHDLQEIMENFYFCTHLPIRAYNIHKEEMLSTGLLLGMPTYNKEVTDWLTTLPNLDEPNRQLTFSPSAHIHFTLCTLKSIPDHALEESEPLSFFLIGPYTDDLSLKEEFAFKPAHCMPHLIELLYTINETHAASVATAAMEDYNYHTIRAQKYIKEHYAEPITLDILAEHLNLNKSYLCTIFKKATKDSFCTYTNKVRIEESKKLLSETNTPLTDIALSVGFSSASYFNTIFKKLEGITPLEYRKKV